MGIAITDIRMAIIIMGMVFIDIRTVMVLPTIRTGQLFIRALFVILISEAMVPTNVPPVPTNGPPALTNGLAVPLVLVVAGDASGLSFYEK